MTFHNRSFPVISDRITVYDIGKSDEGPYIVMEHVSGRTLRELLEEGTPIESVAEVGSQIAKALSVAHQAGIVHRDIKPENVMVREDRYVKVLDFGLSRLVGNALERTAQTVSAASGRLLGTARYMSPEQARGETPGPASDVFSLGLVLYEMATGRYPFEGSSLLSVLHAIHTAVPHPPSHWNKLVPERLDQLIVRMLEKEPFRRPTAAEVTNELSGAAVEGRPAVYPVASVEQRERSVAHRSRRRKTMTSSTPGTRVSGRYG